MFNEFEPTGNFSSILLPQNIMPMKKIIVLTVASVAFIMGVMTSSAFIPAQPGTVDHPVIAQAIQKMQNAIEYMEKAPHDFGGHREAAIRDTKQAIVSLKLALAYH